METDPDMSERERHYIAVEADAVPSTPVASIQPRTGRTGITILCALAVLQLSVH